MTEAKRYGFHSSGLWGLCTTTDGKAMKVEYGQPWDMSTATHTVEVDIDWADEMLDPWGDS